jgi:hypothetical protein
VTTVRGQQDQIVLETRRTYQEIHIADELVALPQPCPVLSEDTADLV